MFEQLFGSKTRVKLIKVFLDNPEKRFFVRELTRLTDTLINSIRRELDNLVSLRIILVEESKVEEGVVKKGLNTKRYYSLNTKNLFLQDLNNLFNKGKMLLEKKLVERIKRLGEIKYLAFSGIFVDSEKAETDIIIIGELDVPKAKESLRKFEEEIGKEIRYTVLSENEYNLRRDIADNFIEAIMEDESAMVIIDKLQKRKLESDHTEIVN